jgi:cell division transport system permease protein
MAKIKKGHRSTKVGNYPYGSVIFSITLALFLFGLFGLILINTNRLLTYIQDNLEVQVYLNSNTTERQATQLMEMIAKKHYLNNTAADSIRFISKEAAAKDLIDQTGEDFISFLGENPLKDAISFKVAYDFQDSASLSVIKADLEQHPQVFEVSYVENVAQLLARNRTRIALGLLIAIVLLLSIIATLINNTIRLALFSQRFLIRSMQLVGATRGFIMKPFLWKSTLYGLIASLFASLLLSALLLGIMREIPSLEVLQDWNLLGILMGSLVIMGIIIALMSTWLSMRKYLNMSLDELY